MAKKATKSKRSQQPVSDVSYGELLEDLKTRIRSSQVKAVVAVNQELIRLYWHIGREIVSRQETEGWGTKVIDRLAEDLRLMFPDMKGFSARNLKYMRKFGETYPEVDFVQQVAAQIPWFHHCILMDKVKKQEERIWYIQQTIQQGWSRAVLVHQIETALYQRQGQAMTNFDRTLPTPQSDLAQQILKDEYNFDFLTLTDNAREKALEHGLLNHLKTFLVELGKGFAFVGSQHHLEVGNQDYYLDLLFYHLQLRCFIVIDLKMEDFVPEHTGKMNFYLSAVDDLLRHPDDQPSIGLILCKSRNKIIVEYALRDTSKPVGIAEYQVKLLEVLPEELQTRLPTSEQLQKELTARDGIQTQDDVKSVRPSSSSEKMKTKRSKKG